MEIVQTVSLAKENNRTIEQIRTLKAQGATTIRFNLCKFSDMSFYSNFLTAIKEVCVPPVLKIIVDIPSERNKCRIHSTSCGEVISLNEGEICEVFYTRGDFDHNKKKAILVSAPDHLPKLGDILFVADGEGALEILDVQKSKIITRSRNKFRTWRNKSITLGFVDSQLQRDLIIDHLHGIDVPMTVAVSLVEHPRELQYIRKRLSGIGNTVVEIAVNGHILEGCLQVSAPLLLFKSPDRHRVVLCFGHIVGWIFYWDFRVHFHLRPSKARVVRVKHLENHPVSNTAFSQ